MSDGRAHASPVSRGERFKLRLSAIVWFLLGAGFLLALPVLLDISVLAVLAVAAVALMLCVAAAWLVRALFRGQRLQSWFASIAKAFVALLFVLGIVAAAPIYYFALLTALRPMTVPQATLSNGTRTVVFQGMSHIGSEGFYKSVVYDLEKALTDGYVLYYEGVQDSPEGDAWFSRTLAGGGDLSANYKMLSDVCGLKFQLDYFGLLKADMAAHPDRHVMADVTTADMMHEYERLMQTDPAFAAAETPAPADASAATGTTGTGIEGIIGWLQAGSPELRRLAGTVCRGFLTSTLSGATPPDEMDKVILEFRNQALADRIVNDTHQMIYITYGANHLPGLLTLLQADNPAWAIQSLKWMRTIAAPEELDGKL
ncbi:MAG: hypothetical protein WBA73_11675 [Devosia sp.]